MNSCLTRPTFLFMFICMLFMPLLSHAEIKAGSTNLTIFAGGYTVDHEFRLAEDYPSNADLDTSLSAGIGLGYNFTKHFGIEAALNHAWTRFDKDGALNRTVKTDLLHLDLLYHFNPDSKCVFYGALGGGDIRSTPVEGGLDKQDDPMIDWGLGFKAFLSESVAFRGDVRHVITRAHGVPEWNNNVLYNLGITFAFGGAEKAAPAAPAPAPVVEPAPAPAPEPAPAPAPVPAPIPEKGRMTLNVQFDTNKAVVKEQYNADLANFAEIMKQNPDVNVTIEGHTDSVGDADKNLQLSQKRADAVKAYLVDKFGIDASRLTAKGYGETKPIADNTTKEGREKNRRVEAAFEYVKSPQ